MLAHDALRANRHACSCGSLRFHYLHGAQFGPAPKSASYFVSAGQQLSQQGRQLARDLIVQLESKKCQS